MSQPTTYTVAFMDVLAPAVQRVILSVFRPPFEVRFAANYDDRHQLALCREADFLVPGWARLTAGMLEAATRVRAVHKWGIGVDRIDVDAARRLGIPLAITAGSNAGPVAELAVALILGVYRRLCYVNREMRAGQWPKAEMRESCFQIHRKTIGLVGFGNIGRKLARRLSGFEPDAILYCDQQAAPAEVERALGARRVELPELLAASDIVSLHLPCTASTRRLIDAAALQHMKKGAVLINTARGELVDEAALAEALQRGHLLGAGLDAFDPEPPDPANPLLALDQVVVTPHAGGGVFDNVAPVAAHVLGNLERFVAGQPLPAQDLIVSEDRRKP
ncbi:2-hydroxyacid dehydrogenase [Bordetella bronchiseptica]|uniref:Dehydrogenase n=3 Tax=Bordetella bronchiseptica TaxID=518 RepID=A0A0H3LIR4_BORBR|nr:2-hydroxyacid dehydrogenase [Bordetella bronchiseptica]KAK66026.1 4-phosphoerythronate dehydrogenase [Bordetella bronchiseptica 980-2]SHR14311.1 D-3-phosphoglycerate dehydrogenase SerA3 [Mycobacteroides abscessus subsp. abscessus]AMG87528.1 dehydrogenase [Bordetella bronchiseptica]AWP73883.1 dehydrogenase [Bordetella bronchiseptica]AWP78716.1 dehydrogenase [Bordetella bronchiseptica]